MTMLQIASTAPLNWTAGLLRITLTLAGALLALVFARLLFRAEVQQRIDDRLARLLRAHADLARAIAERPERGDAPIRAADQATAAAETWTGRRAGSDHREKSAPGCSRPAGSPSAYGTT